MSELITIKVYSKNGVTQKRNIKANNLQFYVYSKKFRAYVKKADVVIKKEKKIIKKQKLKIRNCEFNYQTKYGSHIGYKKSMKLADIITDDTRTFEITEFIQDYKDFVHKEFNLLICPQRLMYVNLEYTIQLSNNLDDIRHTSQSTQTSKSLRELNKKIKRLVYDISNIAFNYKQITITKINFVNYDFRNVVL